MFFMKEIQDILGEKIRQVVHRDSSRAKIIGERQIYFVKYASSGETEAFFKEARGLEAMRETGAIDVIGVLGVRARFLLLEYLEPRASGGKSFFQKFGTRLARMHRHTGKEWGFVEDNFLGSSPQINLNPERLSWEDFFWQKRLLYQCRLGVTRGMIGPELEKKILNLGPVVKGLLRTGERPSLLHGDLWSGNYLVNGEGEACLIDPAVYYGHREAELAMCRLFGGFSPDFYEGYEKEFPLEKDAVRRLPLYQLYHLLNHLNLFGKSYLGRVEGIVDLYC